MVKESIYQKIQQLSMYTYLNRALKFIKQNLIEKKKQTNQQLYMEVLIYTLKTSIKHKLRKDRKDLNNFN